MGQILKKDKIKFKKDNVLVEFKPAELYPALQKIQEEDIIFWAIAPTLIIIRWIDPDTDMDWTEQIPGSSGYATMVQEDKNVLLRDLTDRA